jgi:hypothetical protein
MQDRGVISRGLGEGGALCDLPKYLEVLCFLGGTQEHTVSLSGRDKGDIEERPDGMLRPPCPRGRRA